MTWAKLDDSFHSHPKVRAAWHRCAASIGVQVMSISYAADQLTDGLIPSWFIDSLIAKPKDRKAAVSTLLDLVLLEEAGSDFMVHDFLDFNPTREQVEAERANGRRRQRLLWDKELRNALRERDGDNCRYCGREVNWRDRRGRTGGTYDHIQPITRGGSDELENLVVCCRQCNSRKGNRTPDQAGLTLLPEP